MENRLTETGMLLFMTARTVLFRLKCAGAVMTLATELSGINFSHGDFNGAFFHFREHVRTCHRG